METQHTPGPWLADFHNEQRNGGRFVTYVRGGNQLEPIAAVPTGVEGYGREEGRANARLIAAAPELLARAAKALEIWDDLYSHACNSFGDGDEIAAFDALRAAIAKATGQ